MIMVYCGSPSRPTWHGTESEIVSEEKTHVHQKKKTRTRILILWIDRVVINAITSII